MKKYLALIFTLFFVAGCLTSCDDKEPVTLTFEDVYGRPGWNVDNPVPPDFFEIVENNEDIAVEEIQVPDTKFKSYKLTTKGKDPKINTQRSLKAYAGKVLTFKYKASEDVSPVVTLDIMNPNSSSMIWSLEKTTEWKVLTFDMGLLIDAAGWGGVGSSMVMNFGDKTGVEIELSDIRMRNRTSAEEAATSAYYFTFANIAPGDMEDFQDLTPNLKTYGTKTYMFQPKKSAGDCNMQSLRTVDITAADNQCYFEYKCADSWRIQIFWLVRGGDETNGDVLPAADDWTAVHLDWEDVVTNKIFKNFPNAGDKGNVMRLDIDGDAAANGTPVYIRGLRLTKKAE